MEGSGDDDGAISDLPELQEVINSSLSARGMLSSSSPPKKRQRTGPPSALHKPFRSPFKTPLKTSSDTPRNTPAPTRTPVNDRTSIPKRPAALTPTAVSSKRRAPTRLHQNGSNPSSPSFATPSPNLDKIQKQHTALLNGLSSLRASLETANQALDIEASTKDIELEALIRKWRSVSKNAAEEVYVATKERVDGSGGVKALREKEKEMKECWGWEDERQEKMRGGEDPGSEEGVNERRARDLYEQEKEAKQDAEDADEDDEGFTMEMMLRSLDIPLETIGYEKSQQRWIE